MENQQLYKLLELPHDVIVLLDKYVAAREQDIPGEIYDKLWIYPGYNEVDDKLPERTLLQRKLKKYLLEGNTFGVAKGYIRR